MMNKTLLLGVLCIVMLIPILWPAGSTVYSNIISNHTFFQQQIETEGYYFFVGKSPKGFENIDHIAVFGDLKEVKRANLPYPGVYTKKGVAYKFSSYKLTRKTLTFTTIPINGIYYSFEGTYLPANGTNIETEDPVLEGVLSKFENGKKLAEAKMQLSLFSGD